MINSQLFISCGGELPLPESFMAGVTTYNSQFLTQSRNSTDHLCAETIIFKLRVKTKPVSRFYDVAIYPKLRIPVLSMGSQCFTFPH
jgi:hypothetical protein